MTKETSLTLKQKCPVSLFWQHKEKQAHLTSNSSMVVRDILTPYFSIPTASRVQNYFYFYKEQNNHLSHPIERLFSFCFQSINKIIKKIIYELPYYDIQGITNPKKLLVSQLPDPVFAINEPQRLFFSSARPSPREEYCPPCLLLETPSSLPQFIKPREIASPLAQRAFQSKGTLRKDPLGLIYLSLEENPFQGSSLKGLICEKDTNLLTHPMGAHIPIFLSKEVLAAENLGIENELGKAFSFSVKEGFSVETPLQDAVEKVWFLEVDSQELCQLREKYLLPSKIGGHSFHIVLFLKMRETPVKKPDTFRLNVSCFAA